MNILVIEDEKDLNTAICDYLNRSEFNCVSAYNKFDAEDRLIEGSFNMVLLDLNLPDGNGMDILRYLKKTRNDAAVFIISARGAIDDKVDGLELGADDYITKPFHMAELNSRVKAILRRKNFGGQTSIKINELELEPDARKVSVNGQELALTKSQYQILELLVSNKNKLVTRENIAGHLWNDDPTMFDNFEFIYGHIKNMRKMIAKAGGKNYIQTVYGVGYKFNPDV